MASEQGLRVVVYARMSVDRTEGKSVRDQLRYARDYIRRSGHTLVAEFHDDGISASKFARKARPDWKKAMDAIRAGEADALWLWTISRASRDRAVYTDLITAAQETSTKLIIRHKMYDPNDHDDVYNLDVDSAAAVRQSGEISVNTKNGVYWRAKDGDTLGHASYGYRLTFDEETGKTQGRVIRPDAAAVLREVVRRLLAGEGSAALAAELTHREVPAPAGGPRWHDTAIRRIATNPVAAGYVVHHGKVVLDDDTGEPVVGNHEAIVSPEDHRTLVARFGDPSRKHQRDSAARHLLSGIAVCGSRLTPEAAHAERRRNRRMPVTWPPVDEPGEDGLVQCGAPLRIALPSGQNKRSAYVCAARSHVSRLQDQLDAYVTEAVLTRLERADARELFAPKGTDPEREEAEAEVARLRVQLAKANEAVANGDEAADIDWLLDLRRRIHPKLEAAERRARPPAQVPAAAWDLVTGPARPRWAELGVGQRREVIKLLVRPVVLPGKRGAKAFDPERVRLEWLH